ncbi:MULTISPECIES: hypothetical protein [unclassified Mesorhizobium]|uniref:hypothetical protein n=1 Tax=unclassified Mesorhizobium TaxID=325217 RepID=UPI000FE85751|nr:MULTISPECIES: hypothetical protein [unclassified Mesorhizobium]RWF47533.1 MAG: hypothetical protein EOS46_13055 [Mesorhizobium sp.]TGQ87229.1 hypothetical protein EN851_28955 [Mesorhizobium sp. M8A.F.Ca.ET.208.01.1.1]TGT49340.1 hypothetical protein EN810_28855 [Mesorhizobium sp. M8A.F.Ca.ET.167.01.1.1]TGT87300.1 hypothetical protein EN804_19655 [Mesorhizobium sp. M8A.F.Ca.ET.161.01.1.1]TGV41165.1 hypothetical protein EN785_19640 [Mesorhizobium sp. M8A.F.Ca.ET.142.01.1.1]
MATRLGLRAVFRLIVAGFLASLTLVGTSSGAAKQKAPEEWPMNFILVRNGDCNVSCIQWISAEGIIKPDTDRQFEKFLRSLKGQRLPIVFQSGGGNVDAALAIGHMIRDANLETAIGRTQLNGCPMLVPRCPEKIVKDGWSEGEVHSGGAYCFSACPWALAGGRVRAAAATARIAVHQITNGRNKPRMHNGRRNLDEISTVADPALKQMMSDYFDEMGLNSADVFAMMGLATPQGLYNVWDAEALKSGIVTKVYSYSEEPGYVIGGSEAKATPPATAAPTPTVAPAPAVTQSRTN